MANPQAPWLRLAFILLLAFAIRVTGLVWGQAYCQGSQGDSLEAYQVAVDYVRGDARAQYLGQPSFNTNSKLPGPLWTLFCAGGLRLGRGSIEGAVWLIILLNTAAIYFTYLLAVRTLGVASALWAALLMAVSPSTVFYSTVVYNPVVMPFLGGLLFLALWQATQRDRSGAIFWVPFLLLVMLQFHTSALMLIPAVIFVLILSPVRLNFLWMVGGVIAGFCLFIPYILGDMAHHWENTRGIMGGVNNPYWPGTLRIAVAPLSFLVNIWTPPGVYTSAEYRSMCRACFGSFELFLAVNALSVIATALIICGAFAGIKNALQGFLRSPRAVFAHSPGMVFLVILFTLPLLVNLPTRKVFQARYCLVLLPPLFALSGAGVAYWLTHPRRRRLVLAVIVVSTCATAWFTPAMFHFQKRIIQEAPRLVPGFGKLEAVYQSLKNHAGKERPIQVVDADYLRALPQGDQLLCQASLIRRYVVIRERQTAPITDTNLPAATYQLFLAEKIRAEDPDVAYSGNGIALIARPPVH